MVQTGWDRAEQEERNSVLLCYDLSNMSGLLSPGMTFRTYPVSWLCNDLPNMPALLAEG